MEFASQANHDAQALDIESVEVKRKIGFFHNAWDWDAALHVLGARCLCECTQLKSDSQANGLTSQKLCIIKPQMFNTNKLVGAFVFENLP